MLFCVPGNYAIVKLNYAVVLVIKVQGKSVRLDS